MQGRGRSHRGWRMARMLVATAAMALAGCGDQSADQRKAFTAFLQTRILDKPGLHVPQLTDGERRAFGPYVADYAIITNFHKALNETVSPQIDAAMAKGGIQSISDFIARRGDIRTAKSLIDGVSGALQGDLAAADAAHGALHQPGELKTVYNQAYDRLVTKAAATFAGIVPVTDRVLASALDLGDYLERNQSHVTITGATLQVKDAATLNAVNAKLQSLRTNEESMQAAQAAIRTLVYGSGS